MLKSAGLWGHWLHFLAFVYKAYKFIKGEGFRVSCVRQSVYCQEQSKENSHGDK